MTEIKPIKMSGKLTAFGHTICPVHVTGIFETCGREVYTLWIDGDDDGDHRLIAAWSDSGRVMGNENMFLEVEA